jgi:hypothetical protein
MSEEKDPFAGIKELLSRIDQVIDLIPDSFEQKENLVLTLKKRQDSIRHTPPTALDTRIAEVANILAHYLPEGSNPELEQAIGDIMCKELP